jgi:hypothetical protein
MGSLPNFFLAGAPKAGTTSLYRDLRQHPAVCMSEPKETWYFFDHRKYERGLDWYTTQFFGQCGEHRAIGEATPGYMAHPESPRRIAESLEVEPQFLFLLRDPVERAFSHYHFDLQRGARDPSRSFSEVIRDPDEQSADPSQNHVGLVELGCYLQHLKRYEQYFGRDRLHPILFADYVNRREETLNHIYKVLGLSPAPIPDSENQNPTKYPINRSLFSGLKRAWARVERMLGPTAEMLNPLRDAVRRNLLSASQDRPSMNPADRAFLRDFYADTNASLTEYLGRDLSHWT